MNRILYLFWLGLMWLQSGFSQPIQTLNIPITAGNDDIEVSTRSYASSSDLELGGFDTDNRGKQYVALRFQNVILPNNAQIRRAYIQFTTKSTNTRTASLTIKCQQGNAVAYSLSENLLARAYVNTTVTWNPVAWTTSNETSTKQQTTDLSAQIQAAIASNWQSGNALSFIVQGNATVNNILNARSYEHNSSRIGVPRLIIDYTVPGTNTDFRNISINEVAPKGTIAISEDWVELYNDHNEPVLLDSFYIAGKRSNPFKWRLKNLSIPAKGFLVLIADGDTLKGADHIDMKLSAGGESIFLFKKVNGQAIEIAAFTFPALAADEENVTFGGNTEGGGTPLPTALTKFLRGTPRASNSLGVQFLRLINNQPRGIVASKAPIAISLAAPSGATIRYTTDHSIPSRTNGVVYTQPINISSSTVLKTFAYTAIGETNVESFSYLYPIKGAELTFPNLVTQEEYENGLKQLPVISISTNDTAFDSKVEKVCSFEYINKFGDNLSTSVLGGILGYGNYSYLFSEQRNLRIKFKSKYGFSKLRHPIFAKDEVDLANKITPNDKFDVLELKIGQDGPNADGYGMMMTSQGLITKTMREMGNIDLHTQYVHAFVNGKYHGIYILKEKYDETLGASYYGGEKEQYDVIESSWSTGRVNEGTITNWNIMKNAINENRFQDVKRYMNVPQFIDFMLTIMYFDNEWEYRAVADRNLVSTKFVFSNHDTDGALTKISDDNAYSYDDKWTHPTNLIFNGPAGMFGKLVSSNNKEFKTLVRDRVYEALQKSNGALTLSRITAKLNELKSIIRPLFNLELARFNRTFYNDNPYYDEEDVENMAHLPIRYQYNLDKWLEKGLAHTLLPVTFNQSSGTVTTPVLATNPNNGGLIYYTVDGSDPMGNDGIISSNARLYTTQLGLNIGTNRVVARVLFNGEFGPKATATYTTSIAFAGLQSPAILSVQGSLDGQRAVLKWYSKATHAADYFAVQKRTHTGDFETIDRINALYSTSENDVHFYNAVDDKTTEGVNIYRIALFSESFSNPLLSDLVHLKVSDVSPYAISPNPTSDYVDIDLKMVESKQVTITVFNTLGKVILSKKTDSAPIKYRLNLEGLENGQYLIAIQPKDKLLVMKKVTIAR